MVSETTMKAIKKSKSFTILTSPNYPKRTNKGYAKFLRSVCKLDRLGYPISKIYDDYGGWKLKTIVCRSADERIDLVECVTEVFDKMHLEIRFMSNGTYIK